MRLRPTCLAAPLLLAVTACDSLARVEVDPATLRFGVRGQTAKVHASPIAKNGKLAPDQICAWSSSDPAVARVAGPHNDATVTAIGPGNAVVRCMIGGLSGEVSVQVRLVSRVTVRPARAALKVTDEPAPFPLEIAAFDDSGAPIQGRVANARCASEEVCRGDARGQLWAVAAGETTAWVEVEGARSADIPVTVVDARTAEGKPQRVRGNPMEEIEREVRKREAEAKKRAGK